MFTLHELEYIKLEATIEDCLLRITLTVSFRREVGILHLRLYAFASRVLSEGNSTYTMKHRRTFQSAELGKLGGFQVFCPIDEIWPIEICDIVPNNYVRVHLFDEVPPSVKELYFIIK